MRAGDAGTGHAHSLRRNYTTVWTDAGVPLRVIDHVTGQESIGMTLGTDTEVTPAGLARRSGSGSGSGSAIDEALTLSTGCREGLLIDDQR